MKVKKSFKLPKLKLGEMYQIFWEDIQGFQGWHPLEMISENFKVAPCVTLGVLVEETPTVIKLASTQGWSHSLHLGKTDFSGVFVIPKGVINEIRKLRVQT